MRFPFYGDTLYDLVAGKSPDEAAAVVVRGTEGDAEEARFTREIMKEIQKATGISDAEIASVAGEVVAERGPTNWEWFQGFLKAIDRFVPHGSGSSIALFTKDVYQYLKNDVIRNAIDTGVSSALTKGVETVVVAHSLGTVVAYNLLRQRGITEGWNVRLFVTVGSPLAINEIRSTLKRLASPMRCPECAAGWFNAMDERDVVALYPLNTDNLPLDPTDPAIVNKRDVRNKTRNRHGIAGYLDDKEVAKRIHDALKS